VPRFSAGLLLYRVNEEAPIEVLLVHPGGPFWVKKDDRVWSIPKGEYDAGEEPLDAAEREFEEELGQPAPLGARIDLGELDQSSAKRVHAWAIEADFDADHITSNTFEMEWPPSSPRSIGRRGSRSPRRARNSCPVRSASSTGCVQRSQNDSGRAF
jgi:predicted NUDIX family NTP pyrophosphohydrolase